MHKSIRLFAVAVSVWTLALAPSVALAEQDTAEEAGWGFASALGSLVYGPTKVAYAIGGTVIGGLAYVFSAGDLDVAAPIWERSVRGDYVLTPAHIRGERPIEFIGRDAPPAVAAQPPPDPYYPPSSSYSAPANDPAW